MKTITIYANSDGTFDCDQKSIPEGYQISIREYPDDDCLDDDCLEDFEKDEDGDYYYEHIFRYIKN